MAEKTCFVIMPMSTPRGYEDHYEEGHFQRVFDLIFCPAIEAEGFVPISPAAEGDDVVQARIIKQLETADLVLCDLSGFNPNVYFELGVRVAMNKTAVHVRDDLVDRIPFDVSPMNCERYRKSLRGDHVQEDIETIRSLISAATLPRNSWFTHFGIQSAAPDLSDSGDVERQYIVDALGELLSRTRETRRLIEPQGHGAIESRIVSYLHRLRVRAQDVDVVQTVAGWRVRVEPEMSRGQIGKLVGYIHEHHLAPARIEHNRDADGVYTVLGIPQRE